MKRITLLIICAITFLNTTAQEDKKEETVRSHEIKFNAFNTIIFKSLDFTYEYLLNSESAVGITVLINLINEDSDFFEDGPYYNESFAITPYYRHYFSRKYAMGFFMEPFAMFNQQKYYITEYDSQTDTYISSSDDRSNNFALGLAIGGKFVSRKGFIFEFFGGVGRNIVVSNYDAASEFVPRLGMSVGYRF